MTCSLVLSPSYCLIRTLDDIAKTDGDHGEAADLRDIIAANVDAYRRQPTSL